MKVRRLLGIFNGDIEPNVYPTLNYIPSDYYFHIVRHNRRGLTTKFCIGRFDPIGFVTERYMHELLEDPNIRKDAYETL